MFKANYKVYIKTKGKYYTNGRKATWTSLAWVMSAGHDAAKQNGGLHNIEIHEFPVTAAVKHSLLDLIEAEKDKMLTKQEQDALKAKKLMMENAKNAYLQGVAKMKAAKELMEKFGMKVPEENTDPINF